jgi:urease accessory protein
MTAHHKAGSGNLEFVRVAERTEVARARANSPLKLLMPRVPGKSAWVFASTFGGGLLAGDELALTVNVGEGCSCLLGTQSATKVYRSANGRAARQTLSFSIGSGATSIIAPHPVTCFANARYIQRQRIHMAADSSLVLIDWFTSGRHASAERWAFDLYESRTDIFIDHRHVFRDALRLAPDAGPIAAHHRTGGLNCFAFALLLGPRFRDAAADRLKLIERLPISPGPASPLMFAASPLECGGTLLRAAGSGSEIVGRWLVQQLRCISGALASDSWSRMML